MKLKKILSLVLAFAMLFSIVGAVQPHAHALELHEYTDDDCGCPVEETDAVEKVEEPEEPEESETAEEPVETEEPGDAEENGTTDEAQPEDAVESEESEDEAEWEPVYDENGNFLYFHITVSRPAHEDKQLTEEQLALPTAELLELIINSGDVGIHVTCSSELYSYDRSYRCARLNFNGIRELETRSDVAPVLVAKLLEYFAKCEPPYSYVELEILEMLFEQPIFAEQMTNELYEIVYQATAERYNISVAEVQATYGGPGVRTDTEVQSDLSIEEASAENVPGEVMPCADTTGTGASVQNDWEYDEDFVITGARIYQIPEEYRREYYQLSEEELAAPTAELVDLILEHEMLPDVGLLSVPYHYGYNSKRKMYNALVELESRPDAVEAILAKYAEILSQPAQWDAQNTLFDLQHLLNEPIYREKISDSLMKVYVSLLNRTESYLDFLSNTLMPVEPDSAYGAQSTTATPPDSFTYGRYNYVKSSYTIQTRGGTVAPFYTVVEDMTPEEQNKYAQEKVGVRRRGVSPCNSEI